MARVRGPLSFEFIGQQLMVKFKWREPKTRGQMRRASALECSSVHVAVSWLRGLLVGDHLVLQTDENLLHGVLWVPVLEHVESLLNLAVLLVNAWNVDL